MLCYCICFNEQITDDDDDDDDEVQFLLEQFITIAKITQYHL